MRSTLRSRLAIGLAAASILAVPVAAAPAVAAPIASSHAELACTKAKIAGASKCIAPGQFCKKAAEKDYRKYGFTCNKKDANGRWHLQKE